jgi:formylglycine-generating enzyme required for sulfatase activity
MGVAGMWKSWIERRTAPGRREPSTMAWIDGGVFVMGSDHHYPEEAPAHEVSVGGFWIDRTTVTNAEFARFTRETGYVTLAERHASPADNPRARPELLAPASLVFRKPRARNLTAPHDWWLYVAGASWRHPQGPGSSLAGLEEHPVVHVAFEDAAAYASWAGKALPTEAEWEFAARGGLDEAEFAWGDELRPNGQLMANTWQGEFPWENLREDGFEGTAPVGSFPPNGYGLYDMVGNVWEWTVDYYVEHAALRNTCCRVFNPRGGDREQSYDPASPESIMPRKVIKGASFLCAPSYCRRYRPAARLPQPLDTSTCHLGFRCISRAVPGARG